MNFENCFPLWNDLNTTQKKIISDNLITQYVKKGTIIHNGNLDDKYSAYYGDPFFSHIISPINVPAG